MAHGALVIGGGLAGAACAIRLAEAGQPVTLLEREAEPRHKVCGEFLSGEALAMLAQLGVGAAVLRAAGAVPIERVRFSGGRTAALSALPFGAMSLTRCSLDEHLLRRAALAGVHVVRGVTVESLDGPKSSPASDPWKARCRGGAEFAAERVVLASGKHDLRGWARPSQVRRPGRGGLLAMKMYWRLRAEAQRALERTVALFVYPGGYGGLQPVENGIANLCCLVRADRLAAVGGGWQSLLRHLRSASAGLGDLLEGAEPLLPKPLAISHLPYGYIRREAAGDGLWAVGDQAAVIPSFTGDGMSIALFSGLAAARSLLQGESSATFQRSVARELGGQVRLASALSKAMLTRPGRLALPRLATVCPGAMGWIARKTRVPNPILTRLELDPESVSPTPRRL